MLRIVLSSAALLLAATTVQAQTGAATTGETTTVSPATVVGPEKPIKNDRQATTGDPNRRVCRTETATGSRLGGVKTCKTAREWDEQRAGAKAAIDRLQTQRALIGN